METSSSALPGTKKMSSIRDDLCVMTIRTPAAQARRCSTAKPDGRFLVNVQLNEAAPPITLLQNWNPGARRREVVIEVGHVFMHDHPAGRSRSAGIGSAIQP